MRGFPNQTCQTEAEWPKTKQIIIGDDTWIGMRAAVLKGSVVGNSAVVGLCAVVTGHVPANHLAYGNPYSIKPLTP
jgi:acetyltransferase-like isoleucine patch superfamily enzyme